MIMADRSRLAGTVVAAALRSQAPNSRPGLAGENRRADPPHTVNG
jgi:hypothetical protein